MHAGKYFYVVTLRYSPETSGSGAAHTTARANLTLLSDKPRGEVVEEIIRVVDETAKEAAPLNISRDAVPNVLFLYLEPQ